MPDQEVAEALRILRRNGIVPRGSQQNFKMFSYFDENLFSLNTYIDLNKVVRFEPYSQNDVSIWLNETPDPLIVRCSIEEFKTIMGVSDA